MKKEKLKGNILSELKSWTGKRKRNPNVNLDNIFVLLQLLPPFI